MPGAPTDPGAPTASGCPKKSQDSLNGSSRLPPSRVRTWVHNSETHVGRPLASETPFSCFFIFFIIFLVLLFHHRSSCLDGFTGVSALQLVRPLQKLRMAEIAAAREIAGNRGWSPQCQKSRCSRRNSRTDRSVS